MVDWKKVEDLDEATLDLFVEQSYKIYKEHNNN